MDHPSDAFKALAHAIKGESEACRKVLEDMPFADLDDLITGADLLLTMADEVAIEREDEDE